MVLAEAETAIGALGCGVAWFDLALCWPVNMLAVHVGVVAGAMDLVMLVVRCLCVCTDRQGQCHDEGQESFLAVSNQVHCCCSSGVFGEWARNRRPCLPWVMVFKWLGCVVLALQTICPGLKEFLACCIVLLGCRCTCPLNRSE
jgi:hypothetical protein